MSGKIKNDLTNSIQPYAQEIKGGSLERKEKTIKEIEYDIQEKEWAREVTAIK